MGAQTATVAKWGKQTIRTTYLSGMLTRLAQTTASLALPAAERGPSFLRETLGLDDRRRSAVMAGVYSLLWLGFVAGGTLGLWATLRWGLWGLAFPLGGLALALSLELS
jgi:uncharacterized membrane protein YoaK (UPF0700 family)